MKQYTIGVDFGTLSGRALLLDAESGAEIGVIAEVLELPAGNVFVIKGAQEHLVPIVPEFVEKVDVAGGKVLVRLIEGM